MRRRAGRSLARVLGATALLLALSACSGNSAKSRYLLAEKLWSDEKYAAAVAEFEKVIQQDPKGKLGLQALFRAGMTETLYLGKHEDAVRKFNRFIEAVPEGESAWEARRQIGEILFSKTEQHDLSVLHYRSLLQARPQDPEAPFFQFRVARGLFLSGEYGDAISEYRELHRKYPDTEWGQRAVLEIGATYFTRGGADAPQEAMDAYQRFLKLYPTSPWVPEAHFGIAQALEEMDQLDAAYAQYEALKDSYPSPKVIQIKLIRIRERQDQKKR